MSILERIVESVKRRVAEQKKTMPLNQIKEKAMSLDRERDRLFYRKIKRLPNEDIKVIAEIKKASPSKGLLMEYDVERMSDIYVAAGADAISVITERDFFQGHPEFLEKIKRRHEDIPILRKDFIVEDYQIYESYLLGADAILLIASILTSEECINLYNLAKSAGMDVLFEVHDEEDLEKAFLVNADIIGINNRNLKTLEININTTFRLKELIPNGKVLVSESGISNREQVEKISEHGIDAILVGTSIVLSENPAKKIRELRFS